MQKNIKNQNIKKNGEVFTPNFLVEIILDSINYNNSNILKKHIIDNSCGQGAFLCQIVKRYFIIAKQNNLITPTGDTCGVLFTGCAKHYK